MIAARAAKTTTNAKAAPKNTPAPLTLLPLAPLGPIMRAACACGGGCPRCKDGALETKRAVTQPGDRVEREADRIAAHAVRVADGLSAHRAPSVASEVPAAGASPLARESRAATGGDAVRPAETPSIVEEVLRTPGRPIDRSTRALMEPGFGREFDRVRVHTDAKAAESTRAVGALAYTVGSHVVFGAGQYAPATAGGRRLLAHELAHVVQQRASGTAQLARTVSPSTFNCPASTHNAPASPFAAIDAVDRHAQALAAAGAILAIVAAVLDPSTNTTNTARAYRARFGNPTRRGGNFINRFDGTTFATREQAAQAEITEIGDRLDRIRAFIGGPIRYTCQRGGVQFHHSNCVSTCRASDVAFSCVPRDLRRIEICPHFWDLTDSEQTIAIIHEAAHMLFDFAHHGSASRAARGRNPECYASFVADIFGITPFDTRCPALP